MTTTIPRPANDEATSKDGPLDGPNSPAAAIEGTTPAGAPPPQGSQTTGGHQISSEAHTGLVAAGSDLPDPAAVDHPTPVVESLLDPALALAADVLDDIERVRIANENRMRQLTRSEVDSDGGERGFGLDENHPDVARLAAMVATLKAVEHDATLNLQRQMRKHPLGAWVKTQRGVGEKQGARLLAAIGDPYINSAKGTPRTVSALWAYCGLDPRDGAARRRRQGERTNWSTKAKMRAYLIAASCIKQLDPQCRDGQGGAIDDRPRHAVPACACSPYRVAYDARRAHTAITHPEWTDGHRHNDALRVASKAILKNLWRVAREVHLPTTAE